MKPGPCHCGKDRETLDEIRRALLSFFRSTGRILPWSPPKGQPVEELSTLRMDTALADEVEYGDLRLREIREGARLSADQLRLFMDHCRFHAAAHTEKPSDA